MSIKKLVSETAIYGLSSVLGRMVYFLLMPLYTGVFTPDEFGIQTDLFIFIAFAFVFYTYRIEVAFFRFSTDKSEKERNVFNTSLTSIIGSAVVFSAILFLIAPWFAEWSGYAERVNLVYLCIGILIFDAINEVPFAKLRLDQRPIQFAFAKLSGIAINVGLNLFFLLFCPWAIESNSFTFLHPLIAAVYHPKFGIGYIFISNLASSLTTFLILLPQWRSYKVLIDKALWSRMFDYSWPLILVGFSYLINEMIDKKMLTHLLPGTTKENLHEMGVYSANYKLATVLTLFTQAFRYGAEPFFFKQKNEANSLKNYALVAKYFLITALFGFLAISFYVDIFKLLFLHNEAYWEGLHVVPIILFANLCVGMYYNFSVWFKVTDRTKWGAVFSILGALLTIGLNLLLIPKFSYTGSAWTTLIVYGSMMIGCAWVGRRYLKVPYPFGKMVGYSLLAFGLFIFSNYFTCDLGLVWKTVLNTGLLGVYLGLVWLGDREELREQFKD